SVGGDLYLRKSDNEESNYKKDRQGAGFRNSHPLAPNLDGTIGYKIDDTTLELTDGGEPDLFPVETANGITSAATLSIAYDKRDDRFAPTDGMYHSVSLEYAGLGGDLNYTKGLVTSRYYIKVF